MVNVFSCFGARVIWSVSGQIRPSPGKVRSHSAQIWPTSRNFGQFRADFGRIRARFGKVRANFGKQQARFGRARSKFGRINVGTNPNLTVSGPIWRLDDIDLIGANLAQVQPRSTNLGAISAEVGLTSANVGRLPSGPLMLDEACLSRICAS